MKMARLFFPLIFLLPAVLSASDVMPVRNTVDSGDWRFEGDAGPGPGETIRLFADEKNANPRAFQIMDIPENISLVSTGTLARSNGIESAGKKSRGEAVLSIVFLKADGSPLPKPRELAWSGKFKWVPASLFARVPAKARKLKFSLEIREGRGEVLFDKTELFWGLPDIFDRENLIIDGGFEYYNALSLWFIEGQTVRTPARAGRSSMALKLEKNGSALTEQDFVVPETDKILKAELAFEYKLESVEISGTAGGFKVLLSFFDSRGKSLGEKVLGPWRGQEGWKHFSSEVVIPPGSVRGTLAFKMENARGMARFDEVRLTVYDKNGPVLRPESSQTDTSRWKAFQPGEGDLQSPLEAGSFLDAPAGKHGFLKAGEDGHFYFEDGTRARFFGVNLQPPQALPRRREARALAARLAGLGFNLVRLTQLDAPFSYPNLFGNSKENTLQLAPESLGRLDYFIAQLKARGIYVQIPLLAKREFKHGDGVEAAHSVSRGARGPGLFDPRLKELQKEYARQLLTHRNPHTKKTLVEEPALAFIEIINENSLCRPDHARALLKLPAFYRKQLEDLWVKYVRDRQLARDPESARRVFEDVRNPEVQRFLAGQQESFLKEMRDFLKGLGIKIPVEGSNFPLDGWDLAVNAEFDFIDRHVYWDRPEGGFDGLFRFHNVSVTRQIAPPEFGARANQPNPVVELAALRVKGKPFAAGEWNFDWPNEFRAAGPLLMAAYGLFQDWDSLVLFNYEGHTRPQALTDGRFFDVSSKPEQLLQIPVAARVFLRGDVQPAKKRETFSIFGQEKVPPFLGLKHGIDRVLGSEPASWQGKENPSVVESDTGELKWDSGQGVVTVNTPKFRAVIGTPAPEGTRLGDILFLIKGDFAVVSVLSVEDLSLEQSRKILVGAFARSENAGMIYNATRTFLLSLGTAPILMEPVEGEISIPLKEREGVKVYALDAAGNRKGEIPAPVEKGVLKIPLGAAWLYEVTFKK